MWYNLIHILLVIVLSLIKPCDPCWEIYHALKIKIMYTSYILAAPTLGVRNNMFSTYPKMFYSYIGNRHKNKFVRINAPNSWYCLSWKVLIAEREAWAMQKLFVKDKEKELKKWTRVQGIWNNGYSDARLKKGRREKKKKEMNKIAHVFL
jgi:hypothetical protein